MKDRNIQVALNAGWCLPGDVNSTGWNSPSPFGRGSTWQEQVKLYAKWVSDSLYQLIEVRGFTNITYIELFTEPQRGSPISKERSILETYQLWADCAKAVTDQLIADGRRDLVKIIGPNEGGTTTSIMNKWVAENAAEYVDIFSSHDYQDFVTEEESLYENENAVIFNVAGSRIQQLVKIEPNTNYTFAVKLKAILADRRTTSGAIIIGAWDADRLNINGLIGSGGQPTERLNIGSTKMFDGAEIPDGIQELSCTFNSGEQDKCVVGVFRDIKETETVVKLYSASLKKEGSNTNLLACPNLTKISQGKLYGHNDPIEVIGQAWRHTGCAKERSGDPYWYLRGSAHTAMECVAKTGKPVWFDEYNVRVERDHFEDPWHGTHRAASMQSLMNSGVQSSLMWTLFDQQWPSNHSTNDDAFVDGDHRYGVMPVLTRSLIPYPVYYSTGLIMKFMGGEPGTHVYEGLGNNFLHATVSKMPDGNLSILVINNKSKADDFSVYFGGKIGVKLNRRLYDPATISPDERAKQIEADSVFEVYDVLSDTLPAGGVAVYTTY